MPLGVVQDQSVSNRRAKGEDYEDRAAEYLLNLGYTLVTRRFRVKSGEIDIVALDGETLVFVEVKFRERAAPEQAMGFTKVQRFNEAVSEYLARTKSHKLVTRNDLVAVTPTEVRHYKGAFRNV